MRQKYDPGKRTVNKNQSWYKRERRELVVSSSSPASLGYPRSRPEVPVTDPCNTHASVLRDAQWKPATPTGQPCGMHSENPQHPRASPAGRTVKICSVRTWSAPVVLVAQPCGACAAEAPLAAHQTWQFTSLPNSASSHVTLVSLQWAIEKVFTPQKLFNATNWGLPTLLFWELDVKHLPAHQCPCLFLVSIWMWLGCWLKKESGCPLWNPGVISPGAHLELRQVTSVALFLENVVGIADHFQAVASKGGLGCKGEPRHACRETPPRPQHALHTELESKTGLNGFLAAPARESRRRKLPAEMSTVPQVNCAELTNLKIVRNRKKREYTKENRETNERDIILNIRGIALQE